MNPKTPPGTITVENESVLAEAVAQKVMEQAMPGAMITGKTVLATVNNSEHFLIIFKDGSGMTFDSIHGARYVPKVSSQHVGADDDVIDGVIVDEQPELNAGP